MKSLFDNKRHWEELTSVALLTVCILNMIQSLKLFDAVGNWSIDSQGLKDLSVLHVIGGIFLSVGVQRLSTHIDYDGSAQLWGIYI